MTEAEVAIRREREALLGEALRPVAAELRLVGVADFAAAVWAQKYGNIEDIVNSSAELYFRPGTLTFGWGAEVSFGWSVPPTIGLDMEFSTGGLTAFFRLKLQSARAGLTLRQISFLHPGATAAEDTLQLIDAIADASAWSRTQRAATAMAVDDLV